MLILAKGLNVFHPIVQKSVVDNLTGSYSEGDTELKAKMFFLIALYSLIRFAADFTNYIREIPFANVSASAEIFIAHSVYNHV